MKNKLMSLVLAGAMVASLGVNCMAAELTADQIAGADTVSGDYNVYTTKEELSDSDYINIICVGKIKGKDKNVIFILKNVFNEDGIKATLKDKDNASVSLTFTAKCTLTDKKPFKILTPKEA